MPPVTGGESVELIEPTIVRMVRRLRAVVTLSERTGGIPCLAEDVGDRGFVWVQSLLTATDAADAGTGVIPAGQELRPCRSTDRADIKVLQRYTVASQGVNVRRIQVAIAIDAQITPALIIGQDQNDIGSVS